jgi:GTPase SAR1 family protein
MTGTNRFRELLLGSKSVGKTSLLHILRNYTRDRCPNILVVFIQYISDTCGVFEAVLNQIRMTHTEYHHEFSSLDNIGQLSYKIEQFEGLLKKYNLKLLLLVDEFQFVYTQSPQNGAKIVSEIAGLSDSSLGVNHIIVSGSSTNLRKLAFAKLLRNEETMLKYPSYEGKDLNSTKLRPHWIFPFVSWNDAKSFCQRFRQMENDEDILNKLIMSGGRPGILLGRKGENENEVPYSLNPNRFIQSQTDESAIICSLYWDPLLQSSIAWDC